MIRTREAGTLRASDEGQNVTLAGWVARRRDHGGVVFIDLRDASGVVQVVWRGEETAPARADAPASPAMGGSPPPHPPRGAAPAAHPTRGAHQLPAELCLQGPR